MPRSHLPRCDGVDTTGLCPTGLLVGLSPLFVPHHAVHRCAQGCRTMVGPGLTLLLLWGRPVLSACLAPGRVHPKTSPSTPSLCLAWSSPSEGPKHTYSTMVSEKSSGDIQTPSSRKLPAPSSPSLLSCTNISVQIPISEMQTQSTTRLACLLFPPPRPNALRPAKAKSCTSPPGPRGWEPPAAPLQESTKFRRFPDKWSRRGCGKRRLRLLVHKGLGAGGGRLFRVHRSLVECVSIAFSSFAAQPIPLI